MAWNTLTPPGHRLALAGISAIGVTFGFARYGYGLFLPELREEFGLSVFLVGLIGSATYVGYLAALLTVGALIARFGPRPLVLVGGLCAAVGMGLVALAQGPGLLITGLTLAGTSAGWAWAPYSDAVDRMVPAGRREHVLGTIASGTAFAVAVAGPLALLAHGSRWRYAWLAFALAALASTAYNARVLPGGSGRRMQSGSGRPTYRRSALPLLLTAVIYGLVGAVYWSFAVEAITDAADTGPATAPLFWSLMGAAGTAGALTGHAIARYGLHRVHTGLFFGIAVAVALLGLAPGSLPAVALSALLYGPCFMAGSGMLAVWSYRVFPERPSAGFSVTVFFLGLGTIAGPALLGAYAELHGLRAAFLLTAGVAALALVCAPSRSARGHGRHQGQDQEQDTGTSERDRGQPPRLRVHPPQPTAPPARLPHKTRFIGKEVRRAGFAVKRPYPQSRLDRA
ncbi:YbfB/YjiJ family MFS transporter [Streptomyces piniterrae]|uniref:YbfB/YjiJ family MFS transporter n=1 Tax=Streptomyces piniterrae TaxID=2571125 RepID=A0A4U0MUM5_9ACTN|nr:MFS transporter [Streptomyces piniterrae]TJZ44643.1 YbfB/YjiJ family MFS transporter [Streptomyces piniterrae]